jgi:hypothetical protein
VFFSVKIFFGLVQLSRFFLLQIILQTSTDCIMAYNSHREYFQIKNQKIQQQHNSQPKLSSLFHGMIFYFDGYVEGGTAKIKVFITVNTQALVLSHSAKLRDMNTSDVSHIFASSMSSKKKQEWIQKPIVKHEWIYEWCVNFSLT